MKVYAVQVNPECQQSYFEFESWPDVAFFGNRNYRGSVPEFIADVIDVLEQGELADYLDDLHRGEWSPYRDSREAVRDYFKTHGKDDLSGQDADKLAEIVTCYGSGESSDRAAVRQALEVVTGREWCYDYLRGNCQGDWIKILYPFDGYTRDDLQIIETEYFNTGTERTVDDSDSDSATITPQEITGFSVYCHTLDMDEIRKEIADAAGADPADVVLYRHAGIRKIDIFEEVA